jgi:hypothetical protein
MAEKQETALVAAPNTFLQEFKAQVEQAKAMRGALAQVMRDLMVEGVHYGVMPGTSTKEGEPPKKVLFKAGAEMLCNVFRLIPEFEIVTRIEEDTFIHMEVSCKVKTASGVLVAQASGSANTREERYYNQCTAKVCPSCKKPTIFRSKQEPYGWFCWEKKGGCGAKFDPSDKALLGQDGQLTPVKVWGMHNTIVQQANKRAMVASVRLATACSDTFTQDMLPDPTDAEQSEEEHQRGTSRPQSGKPASTPRTRATAEQIRDLNGALGRASVALPDRLPWVNAMLKDMGIPEVSAIMDLSPDQAETLAKAAAAGKMPGKA